MAMRARGDLGKCVQTTGGPMLKIEGYKPKGKRAYKRIIANGVLSWTSVPKTKGET